VLRLFLYPPPFSHLLLISLKKKALRDGQKRPGLNLKYLRYKYMNKNRSRTRANSFRSLMTINEEDYLMY